MKIRRGWLWVPVLLLGAGLGAYATKASWLGWFGGFLVRTDPLQRADIVVVLAGDGTGERILRAAELVTEGYAPRALVDGPLLYYGHPESDLAIDFAVSQGYSREMFDPLPMEAYSTLEEAYIVDAELRRRGVRKALVVTSDYHTRRARLIYQKHTSGEVEYVFLAAPHPFFSAEGWWRDREGKKIFLLEFLKTVNSSFE
jgi:uncharacterized SAM-binding protein YcdF (DUF218 family)